VVVDLNRCQAYAQCCFLAPGAFHLHGEEVLWYDPAPDATHREAIVRAAAACPVQAIFVEQAGATEKSQKPGARERARNQEHGIHQNPTIVVTQTNGTTTTVANPCYDPAYHDWSSQPNRPASLPWILPQQGYEGYNFQGNYRPYNGRWVTLYPQIPLTNTTASANTYYWYLLHRTTSGQPFTDRTTVAVQVLNAQPRLEL
jgi:ferredoxin